jgi:tRNA pseudouridine38-40 synthase
MTRYFITLAYHGGSFVGWQRQPKGESVQGCLERALSTILRDQIEVTGCGRTDAGVHARHYVAHFDTAQPIPPSFLVGTNSLLPPEIAVYTYQAMPPTAHARYDAYERAYEYHIVARKSPFERGTVWQYPQAQRLDVDKLHEVAAIFPQYNEFFPFCKTHSGVDHYRCDLRDAHWELLPDQHRLVFHVTANRFLRGMVRLMVGACVQAGMGQISPDAVRDALERQVALPKHLSVPAEGLYLTRVEYP